MDAIVAANVDQYIAQFPPETRAKLEQLRATIQGLAPQAEECISYQMPAYKFHGVLVFFAGYKKHIGFYPSGSGIEAFQSEFTGYKWSKGAIQFALDKPLPIDLITRIVQYRLLQNQEKAATKPSKKKK